MHTPLAMIFGATTFIADRATQNGPPPSPQATISAASSPPVAADSADAMWRDARAAISDERWDRAVLLFERLRTRYPHSTYVADSYYWQAFALYQQGGSAERREAVTLLDRQQHTFASAATRTSGDAQRLRTRISGQLAMAGDARAAADIARGANSARAGVRTPGGCKDEEDDDRIEALNALLQMDGERALPILKTVLARRDACSEILRRKAVFLVSQKRGDDAADILIGVARNDPDAEAREQAVFWLGQTHSDKAVDLLEGILKTSNDEDLLEKALFAISQTRGTRGNTLLRDYAARDAVHEDLRAKAIFWLGQTRSDENATFLKDLFLKVRIEELQERILFVLSQQRAGGNGQFLIDQAMNEKNPVEVRKKAIFWAGQSNMVDIAQLSTFYDKATDVDFKEQIIFVLQQRRESGAVGKLIDIARSDKNRELRKKAVFWLGQSRDPRAAKFLADLIGTPE